ncbi:MAG: septal ring lytic transglycosylase RlpA family protein [Hyphomicrobium sp.]|uniref:septal ring lytic transglycosylase RlpA family protein n=1 Tax=Hyphomicrobium sp. TaxID=82 RepID=UPI003D122C94
MRIGLSVIAPALGALALAAGSGSGAAEAKTPGKTYCFYGTCHRVKTIAETEALVGTEETVSASHYDSCARDRYNPCGLTSSGEAFDSEAPDNAASPTYPDGTTLLVWSPETRASLVLRVNNAGPYWGDRKLDVSRKAAEVLGFAAQGVATLQVRVIDAPSVDEATYKKDRTYDPVPGYIGEFASLDEAQSAAATAYMVAGLPSPFGGTVTLANAAGSSGTQSGAAVVLPALLASVDAAPAAELAAVAISAPLVTPVKVAGFVRVAELAESEFMKPERSAAPMQVAEAERTMPPVARKRHQREQEAARNSRSYRVAAKERRERKDRKGTEVAEAQKPKIKSIVTQDGTNDLSMFSRHVYAGVERLAAEEPERRRKPLTSAARYALRADNEG